MKVYIGCFLFENMGNTLKSLALSLCLLGSSGCSTASREDRESISKQVYQQLESISSDSLEGMQERKLADGRRILYDQGVKLIERSSIDGRKNFGAFGGTGKYLEFDETGKLVVIILLNGEERRGLFLSHDGNFSVQKNGFSYSEEDSKRIEDYRGLIRRLEKRE